MRIYEKFENGNINIARFLVVIQKMIANPSYPSIYNTVGAAHRHKDTSSIVDGGRKGGFSQDILIVFVTPVTLNTYKTLKPHL